MSHVVLNSIYRLRMLAVGRLKARGLTLKLLESLVRVPGNFDRFLSSVVAKVLNGVSVVPELSNLIEREIRSSLAGSTRATSELGGKDVSESVSDFTELGVAPPSGVVQRVVRYSSLTESLAVSSILNTSTFLLKLQRSLERSLLISALLSGVVTTLVFLILAIQ